MCIHAAPLRPPRFRPLLGHEDAAERPFAADADSREEAEDRELPDVRRGAAEKGEERVAEDRQDQRADAAEAVGERPPEEGEAPADQEDGEEQAAVEADVGRCRRDAGAGQQIASAPESARGHR